MNFICLHQIIRDIIRHPSKMYEIIKGATSPTRYPDAEFLEKNIADVVEIKPSEPLVNGRTYKLLSDSSQTKVQVFQPSQKFGAINAKLVSEEIRSHHNKSRDNDVCPVLRSIDYASDAENQFFIVHENFDHTLKDFVKEGKHVRWKDDLIIKFLEALKYLHSELKLMHGALSPESVVILQDKMEESPKVKLTGLTKAKYRWCKTEDIASVLDKKPRHVSPFARDIFSAAMIIIFILTGNVINPVQVNNNPDYLNQFLTSNGLNEDYKVDEMSSLFKQMISKDLQIIPTIQDIFKDEHYRVFLADKKIEANTRMKQQRMRLKNGNKSKPNEDMQIMTIRKNPEIENIRITLQTEQSYTIIALDLTNLTFGMVQDINNYNDEFNIITRKEFTKIFNEMSTKITDHRETNIMRRKYFKEMVLKLLEMLVKRYFSKCMSSELVRSNNSRTI